MFLNLVRLSEKLSSTSKRTEMVGLASAFLAKLDPGEVEPTACMLLGRPFPNTSDRSLEVSWATLAGAIGRVTGTGRKEFDAAFAKSGDIGSATAVLFRKRKLKRQQLFPEKRLQLLEVKEALDKVASLKGTGVRKRKERMIESLLNRCGPLEAKCLVKIIVGEMRTGFQEGLMELAVAKAFRISAKMVRRATMFAGDVAVVAGIAARSGEDGLKSLKPTPFMPVSPMLAQVAENVDKAVTAHGGRTAFEYKLDGARVQIHKKGDEVKVYSRRLSDVTFSLPEVVRVIKLALKANEAIVEGEVIAVDRQGFPLPFQYLLKRFRREKEIEKTARQVSLGLQLFDLLYLEGHSLVLDEPYERRRELLSLIASPIPLTTQMITSNPAEAREFLRRSLREGHEGLMAKQLGSLYTPGARGKLWLKIKPVLEPLDLVIVGAEWGYGRRHEWLSDYYLAARDESSGEFEVIGKTFKGLNDEEIKAMTRQLKTLVAREERRRVWVLPKIVVEVAYNEIQKSPKYSSGMALRFARITRLRPDKSPIEADTLARVREIFERQVKRR